MAEALARHQAADVIEAFSAGISPLGRIADGTRRVLLERGVRMEGQSSKSVGEVDVDSMDLVVNMTGMPGKSLFPGAKVADWEIDDPYGEDLLQYRECCEAIEEKVALLADELRREARNAEKGQAAS
jgi:protein-tyrosine-phosphatase